MVVKVLGIADFKGTRELNLKNRIKNIIKQILKIKNCEAYFETSFVLLSLK